MLLHTHDMRRKRPCGLYLMSMPTAVVGLEWGKDIHNGVHHKREIDLRITAGEIFVRIVFQSDNRLEKTEELRV